MAKTGGNYLQITYFVVFSAGYPAIYRSAWLHGVKQIVSASSSTVTL